MAHQPLTIVARFKAKPGMKERVKQDLLNMLAPSRSETGCITYELYTDLAEPSMFVLYEIWQDQASLDAHFTTPYSKRIAKAFEETLVEPYEMTLLQRVSH